MVVLNTYMEYLNFAWNYLKEYWERLEASIIKSKTLKMSPVIQRGRNLGFRCYDMNLPLSLFSPFIYLKYLSLWEVA